MVSKTINQFELFPMNKAIIWSRLRAQQMNKKDSQILPHAWNAYWGFTWNVSGLGKNTKIQSPLTIRAYLKVYSINHEILQALSPIKTADSS